MFSIKRLILLLPILYLFFQLSPFNPVDLRFSHNAKKLSVLNTWIKDNKKEYELILKTEIKEVEEVSFESMSNDTSKKTKDEKFSYQEVKKLSSDIETFSSWNAFRNKSITYSILFLICYIFVMRKILNTSL